MTEPNVVTTTLEAYAEHADAAPADLLDRVESRYRRRRNRRTVGAGAAVMVLVAAVIGGVALSPFGGGAPTKHGPASPSKVSVTGGNPNAWHLPSTSATLPTVQETWPNASFRLPANTPDGGTSWPMGALDGSHVLVESHRKEAAGGLYSFDTKTGAFKVLVGRVSPTNPAFINRFAVAPHWIVWEVDGNNSMDVYKLPIAGGTPQLVAHVATDSGSLGPWTATDQAIYWSAANSPGIDRLMLSGGKPVAMLGFEKFQLLDGSQWAVRTTTPPNSPGRVTHELKNIVSGDDRLVTPLPGAVMLTCAPSYCVGWNAAGAGWIQDTGGAFHQALPSTLRYGSLCNCGQDGRAVYNMTYNSPDGGSGYLIWTPSSGQIGVGVSRIGKDGSSSGFGDVNSPVLGWQTVAGGPIDEYVALGLLP
jgi:hypothetical protein